MEGRGDTPGDKGPSMITTTGEGVINMKQIVTTRVLHCFCCAGVVNAKCIMWVLVHPETKAKVFVCSDCHHMLEVPGM